MREDIAGTRSGEPAPPSAGRVAVVTGANQGLGYALVEALCRVLGPDGVVYLTARDRHRGQAATTALRGAGLSPVFHPLDVTAPASVATLAETLHDRHGGVDVVISNAAARIDPAVSQASQVRQFVDTNNHGTTRVIRVLGPLLRDGARYVVVASSFGTLRQLPPALHDRFDAGRVSLADVDEVMDDYVAAVEAGRAAAEGWPEWINVPSKVGQVAATKVLARDMRARGEDAGILINAACPGLVDTAASRPWFRDMANAQSPADAARDIVWLATLPDGAREPTPNWCNTGGRSCGAEHTGESTSGQGEATMLRARERAVAAGYRCPVDLTLDVIGGKWKPLILWELHEGPRRFNALLAVVGMTHKVLTQQLRDLERRDIVVRTVREKGEPHVQYALSPLGRTLRPVLTVMAEWARAHHGRLGATLATKGATPSR